jgi:hypothetical protein
MRFALLVLLLLTSASTDAATLVHGRMIQDGSIGTADLADDAVTLAKLGFNAANVDATNTFNADQTLLSADAGATEGPLLDLLRFSASPAANDEIGGVRFRAISDTAAQFNVGVIGGRIVDPANASKDGWLTFATMIGNSLATRFQMGAGLMYQGGADPGAGAINATGFQLSGTALPLVREYVSADQTIIAAQQLTLAHGLGAMPEMVQLRLKCTTAEHGYSIGDELMISAGEQNADIGISVVATSTSIVVRYGATGINILDKDMGETFLITEASWVLIVRAWN